MNGTVAPDFDERERFYDILGLSFSKVFFNRLLRSHIQRSGHMPLCGSESLFFELNWSLMTCAPEILAQMRAQANPLCTHPDDWTCDIDFMVQDHTFAITFQASKTDRVGAPVSNINGLLFEYDKITAQMYYMTFLWNLKRALSKTGLSLETVASNLELDVDSLANVYVLRMYYSYLVLTERQRQIKWASPNSSPTFN